MSLIMTTSGWRQLTRPVRMEVWDRVSFNPTSKQYEPDNYGTLRCVGYTTKAEPSFKEMDWAAYYARHDAYCNRLRSEVQQSKDRRAGY